MRLPIFQLCYTFQDSRIGLSFASDANSNTQNIFFALPIPKKNFADLNNTSLADMYQSLLDTIKEIRYYFPCEVQGKNVDLYGDIESGVFDLPLIINFTPNNNEVISFALDHLSLLRRNTSRSSDIIFYDQYHGDFRRNLFRKFIFLPLIPIDMLKMNRFFYEKQGILVGYTPQFGNFPFENFNF